MDSFFGLDRVSKAGEGWTLLITVYDRSQLMILESILRDAEIPCLAKERGGGTAVRVITGYSMFGTDLFVPEELYEVAAELIAPPERQDDAEKTEDEE